MSSESSWSNVTHVSPSSDDAIPPSRASSPTGDNIRIQRQSPSKIRSPTNVWTLVRRHQRPALDIDDALQFPSLRSPPPPVSPPRSASTSDDDNVILTGRVNTALR